MQDSSVKKLGEFNLSASGNDIIPQNVLGCDCFGGHWPALTAKKSRLLGSLQCSNTYETG